MKYKISGFTLVEVLITLGIVGIVAAITIPQLISNYRKHMVETKLKYTYSTVFQALRMHQAIYGDFSYNNFDVGDQDANGYSVQKSKIVFDEIFLPIFTGAKHLPQKNFSVCFRNGNKDTGFERYTAWYSLSNGTIIGFTRAGNYDGAVFNLILNPQKEKLLAGKDVFQFIFTLDATGKWQYNSIANRQYSTANRTDYIEYCKNESNKTHPNYPQSAATVADFCTVLIVRNNFRIPSDYPITF